MGRKNKALGEVIEGQGVTELSKSKEVGVKSNGKETELWLVKFRWGLGPGYAT